MIELEQFPCIINKWSHQCTNSYLQIDSHQKQSDFNLKCQSLQRSTEVVKMKKEQGNEPGQQQQSINKKTSSEEASIPPQDSERLQLLQRVSQTTGNFQQSSSTQKTHSLFSLQCPQSNLRRQVLKNQYGQSFFSKAYAFTKSSDIKTEGEIEIRIEGVAYINQQCEKGTQEKIANGTNLAKIPEIIKSQPLKNNNQDSSSNANSSSGSQESILCNEFREASEKALNNESSETILNIQELNQQKQQQSFSHHSSDKEGTMAVNEKQKQNDSQDRGQSKSWSLLDSCQVKVCESKHFIGETVYPFIQDAFKILKKGSIGPQEQSSREESFDQQQFNIGQFINVVPKVTYDSGKKNWCEGCKDMGHLIIASIAMLRANCKSFQKLKDTEAMLRQTLLKSLNQLVYKNIPLLNSCVSGNWNQFITDMERLV